MRLGPKEKQILRKLSTETFTPPSVYLGDYGSCPSKTRSIYSINRIVEKSLAVFRYQTQTSEENKLANKTLSPGREAAEYNGALLLTLKGKEIIAAASN